MHRKDQGSLGEALVISQVLENNLAAFSDFGDNSKIDLIVEDSKGVLHKVQVKTPGRETLTPNVSKLSFKKFGPNYSYKYKTADIDWFAVVDFETKKIAWIRVNKALLKNASNLNLRHVPTKNKQVNGIKFFSDFEKFPFE